MKHKKIVIVIFIVVISSIIGISIYKKHQSYNPYTCSYPGEKPKCASGSYGF